MKVTDGAGNVVSGGSLGGKANYLYRPYGEIDRMNSSGPDITKFKYTGQGRTLQSLSGGQSAGLQRFPFLRGASYASRVEDKESGLYYYKARYYDASLGRFNSADSLIMPESIQGMNRYMYVEGNPVKYNDPTGHSPIDKAIGDAIGRAFRFPNLKKFDLRKSDLGRSDLGNGTFEGNYYRRSDLRRGDLANGAIEKSLAKGERSVAQFLERGLGLGKVRSYFVNLENSLNNKEYRQTTKKGKLYNAAVYAIFFNGCSGINISAQACASLYFYLWIEYEKGDDKIGEINPFFRSGIDLNPRNVDDGMQCGIEAFAVESAVYNAMTTTPGVYGHSSSTSSPPNANAQNTSQQFASLYYQHCTK